MSQSPALDALIEALKVLPGVGPKSAQRIAFHLLQREPANARKLALALSHVLEHVQHCQRCNTFCESDICDLCASDKRDISKLCIVEMPSDQMMMEQAHCFDGLYFILMGKLSPLDGIGVKDLAIDKLIQRCLDGHVSEVILATNFTVEGEATAHYLSEALKRKGLTVTRIARGLPAGGELEYVDGNTLAQAFYERRQLKS